MHPDLHRGLQLSPPRVSEITAAEAELGIVLPADLRAFYSLSNGFNDDLGQGYLVLWGPAELALGRDYALIPPAPNRFLIGSNGGPTAYGVVDGAYVALPFMAAGDWQDEMRRLATSFEAFIDAIARGDGW